MIITEKIGNINSIATKNRTIDTLNLEWFESSKRIMHKKTASGKSLYLKFLKQDPAFTDGDIIWMDNKNIIAIEIDPCETIIIKPNDILEATAIAYEIGNKHLPLFYRDDEILVPYDAPLFRLLSASGYNVNFGERKLLNAVKTTVSPHAHSGNSTGLFTKILNLTTSA